jgi:hypothetical protein
MRIDPPRTSANTWLYRAKHRDERVFYVSRIPTCPLLMGTCVRMYVISDPARPHVALGTAATLEAIADALAARSEPDLVVYISQDGLSHGLDAAEQLELDERIQAVRWPSVEGERSRS